MHPGRPRASSTTPHWAQHLDNPPPRFIGGPRSVVVTHSRDGHRLAACRRPTHGVIRAQQPSRAVTDDALNLGVIMVAGRRLRRRQRMALLITALLTAALVVAMVVGRVASAGG